MDVEDYRELPEWATLIKAVNDLVEKLDSFDENAEPVFVGDVVVTLSRMNREGRGGGYSHYSTSSAPHVSEGLHHQGIRYWSTLVEYEAPELS